MIQQVLLLNPSVLGCNSGLEPVRNAWATTTLNYLEVKGCDVSNVHMAFTLWRKDLDNPWLEILWGEARRIWLYGLFVDWRVQSFLKCTLSQIAWRQNGISVLQSWCWPLDQGSGEGWWWNQILWIPFVLMLMITFGLPWYYGSAPRDGRVFLKWNLS